MDQETTVAKVKVLCQFCGKTSEIEPQYVNTGEPCQDCRD